MADELLFDLTPKDDNKLITALNVVYDVLSKIAAKGLEAAKAIGQLFAGVGNTGGSAKVGTGGSGGLPQATPVGGIQGAFPSAALAVQGLSALFEKLAAGPIGATVAGIKAVIGVFNTLTASTAEYVRAYSPAAVDALNLAYLDLDATIGQKLLPIIQAATGNINHFADRMGNLDFTDFIQSLTDTFAPLIDIFTDLLAIVGEVASVIGKIFVPVVTTLGVVFRGIANVLSSVVDFVTKIAYVIGKILSNPANAFRVGSLWEEAGTQANAGRATGVRGISLGSIEGISDRALVAAGRIGQGRSPEEETAANTAELVRQGIRFDARTNAEEESRIIQNRIDAAGDNADARYEAAIAGRAEVAARRARLGLGAAD